MPAFTTIEKKIKKAPAAIRKNGIKSDLEKVERSIPGVPLFLQNGEKSSELQQNAALPRIHDLKNPPSEERSSQIKGTETAGIPPTASVSTLNSKLSENRNTPAKSVLPPDGHLKQNTTVKVTQIQTDDGAHRNEKLTTDNKKIQSAPEGNNNTADGKEQPIVGNEKKNAQSADRSVSTKNSKPINGNQSSEKSGTNESLKATDAVKNENSGTNESRAAVSSGMNSIGGGAQSAFTAESSGSSGGGVSTTAPSGDSSETENSPEAVETEERIESASPENADRDIAAEAQDDPEIAAEVPMDVPDVQSEENTSAGNSSETGTSQGSDINTSDSSNRDSYTSRNVSSITPPVSNNAQNANISQVTNSEQDSQTEAESTVQGGGDGQIDTSEQQAAIQSLSAGNSSGEPATGGGGGGGGAIESKPAPEPPDISGLDPEAAIAGVENLPPGTLVGALGGVKSSVNDTVAKKQTENASNPPQAMFSAGPSPNTAKSSAGVNNSGSRETGTIKKVPAGQSLPVTQPQPIQSLPPSPISKVNDPGIHTAGSAQLGPDDAQAIQNSVRRLPLFDNGLNITAGEAPSVQLRGDADPSQVKEQAAQLQAGMQETAVNGRKDAMQPMGEDAIYSSALAEQLRSQTAPEGSGGASGGSAKIESAGEGNDAASIIAQQQYGSQLKAASAQAKSQMAKERSIHAEKEAEARSNNQKEMDQLQTENANEQNLERVKANAEVVKAREVWTSEQQEQIDSSNEEALKQQEEADQSIEEQQQQADLEAQNHIDEGNQEAQAHREAAEKDAAEKKAEAEQESDGILGWVASKAKAFFDKVKSAINTVFEAARRLVKAAIEKAKRLAAAVIEKARQAIVNIIRAIGNALIAIGDRLLAAFPALRDKWRSVINSAVEAAVATVNRLAEALKKGIQKLLDLLGKALDFALRMLQKGLLAVVSAYQAAVNGILKAAQAVADAFGAFVALIKDVASGPAAWLRNLGASVVDGIRNHLWKAFKEAVKNWFNSKLEEVLGIGGMIWGLLKKGGLAIKEVGGMAWEGIKSAIPAALIGILVEKLVAMIVPAAGAVIAIIEGLQAAWGTVSRIIAAFSLFFQFLKAVKGGNAGSHFAKAVAAAAVVMIDFVANWLIRRIRGPASKIGSKIKAIAKKIGQRLKRAASKAGKALKKAGSKIKSKIKGARDKFKAWRDKNCKKKGMDDPDKKKKDKEAAKQKKLEKAVEAIQPKVDKLLSRGVGKTWLRLKLFQWRIQYGLTDLKIIGNQVEATVNPKKKVSDLSHADIGKLIEPVLIAAEAVFLEYVNDAMVAEDVAKSMNVEAPEKFRDTDEITDILRYRRFRSGDEVPPAGFRMRTDTGTSIQTRVRQSLSGTLVAMGSKSSYSDIDKRIKSGQISEISGSLRGLMTLERARMPGMLPAMDIAESLQGQGAATVREVVGTLNPMKGKGASKAAEIESGMRAAPTSKRDIAKHKSATLARQKAIGRIFDRLKNIASRPQSEIVNKPGSKELVGVAEAFEKWKDAHLRYDLTQKSAEEIEAASIVLGQQLIMFLKTFRN